MPPNPDRVWLLAQAVKTAIVAGYVTASVELPDHQFVAPGVPAWDCNDGLLAVQVENTYGHSGSVGVQTAEPLLAMPGHALRGATIAIHLIRCVPTIDDDGGDDVSFPSADEEEDAAEVILRDAQLLLNVLVAAERAGDLPGCNSIVFLQWLNVEPLGGLGGGILRVQIGME